MSATYHCRSVVVSVNIFCLSVLSASLISVSCLSVSCRTTINRTFKVCLCWRCPRLRCENFWSIPGVCSLDDHEFLVMVFVYHYGVLKYGFLPDMRVVAIPALIFSNCFCVSTILVSS